MKKVLSYLLAFLCTFSLPSLAAGDRASAQDAINMVHRVKDFIKANGKEKTIAEINNPQSKVFIDRDIYVVINGLDGTNLAHGANQKLVGRNIMNIKDADDRYFIREQIETSKKTGKGWIDYKWPNASTQKIEDKTAYFERVDDFVIACGIYK